MHNKFYDKILYYYYNFTKQKYIYSLLNFIAIFLNIVLKFKILLIKIIIKINFLCL
jgi:hypothetical protein